ncbi:MAG: beta-N-acetylglucosaminidase domain-containing protein [bacterium]
MKKYLPLLLIPVLVLAGLYISGKQNQKTSVQKETETNSIVRSRPGRARLARITASSFRLARIEEIPRAKEFSDIFMDKKNNWPRRRPLYAADQSPLTYWATAGNRDEYIQYDFKNRLADDVRIAAVRLRWGRHPASGFELRVSKNGKHWKALAIEDSASPEVWTLSLNEPIETRYVRLVCKSSETGKGFSVRSFEVYGAEVKPGPPKRLSAKKAGKKRVRLKWSPPAGETAYRYCVFRGKDEGFKPARSNRIACTDHEEYTDLAPKGGTYNYLLCSESFGGSSACIRSAPVSLSGPPESPFRYRGVVEGFYNDPWPHQERLKMISFMARCGMNYYLYAPKHDHYHRQLWRKPYPEKELDNFRELLHACHAHAISFNFGISPGLDYDYANGFDFEKLKDKLDSLFELGVRSFTLCMDDITGWKEADANMARNQVKLANRLHNRLRSKDPDSQLFFVPTVYMRTYDHWQKNKPAYAAYLRAIKGLHPDIEVMWTGPGMIFSEKISAESARSMEKVWERKPVIWDNVPVNDVTLRRYVIMAPYKGRDHDLYKSAKGALLNPMYLPNASMVTLYTAGRYLQAPQSYDPAEAYEEALQEIAGEDRDSFRALCDALSCHPLFPGQGVAELPLTKKLDAFRKARKTGHGAVEAQKELRELFASYVKVPKELEVELDNFELQKELEGPARKLALYGKAGLLALDYLDSGDKETKKDLARKIRELRTKAREIPWKVADNTLEGLYTPPGSKEGRHENVMEEFLGKTLSR